MPFSCFNGNAIGKILMAVFLKNLVIIYICTASIAFTILCLYGSNSLSFLVLARGNSSNANCLTENDIVSWYETIQELITKHLQLNVDASASDLFSTLVSNVPLRDSSECNLQYSGVSMENRMWSLALLSTSWLLNNLKMKTENGHCQNTVHSHGDKTPRLCPFGSKFHRELYI
jgi:hypothetical protein